MRGRTLREGLRLRSVPLAWAALLLIGWSWESRAGSRTAGEALAGLFALCCLTLFLPASRLRRFLPPLGARSLAVRLVLCFWGTILLAPLLLAFVYRQSESRYPIQLFETQDSLRSLQARAEDRMHDGARLQDLTPILRRAAMAVDVSRLILVDAGGRAVYDSTGTLAAGAPVRAPEVQAVLSSRNGIGGDYGRWQRALEMERGTQADNPPAGFTAEGRVAGAVRIRVGTAPRIYPAGALYLERPARRFEPLGVPADLQSLVALSLSLGAALWLAGGLARPLGELQRGAAALAEGDLSRRVPARRRDELGLLAGEFNRMADRIQSLVGNLTAEQARLRDALSDLQLAREAQERFLADVSHDLRTPLASMQIHLEAILDGVADTPERRRRGLGHVHGDLLYLSGLVEDLLDASRLRRDLATSLDTEAVDVVCACRAAIVRFSPIAEETRKEVGLQTTSPSLTISADPGRLTQALNNLLDNALQHAPEGGRVVVALTAVEDGAEIRVRDDGPGIPEERMGRIFDRFYRADSSRPRGTEGLGLGLAIAREVIEAHGGRLTARNHPAGGAEFLLWLPKASAEHPGAPGADERAERQTHECLRP